MPHDLEKEHEVTFSEILSSMAESLVETHAVFRVRDIKDPPRGFTTGLKPPKEIFYRNSVTFMTVLPPPTVPKRCSCVYLCTGAKATIKCLSCAIYDPNRVGYFCDACFKARHPWYRVPHIYTSITKDENIEYTLKIQNRCAQAARLDREGQDLLQGVVRASLKKLDYDDLPTEEKLLRAGSLSVSMEDRLMRMREENRDSIKHSVAFKGLKKTLEESRRDHAVDMIGKCFRGYQARVAVSLLYTERTLLVWDPAYGRDFYYDKISGASSWTPPRFLLKRHLDQLESTKDDAGARDDEGRRVWLCKNFDDDNSVDRERKMQTIRSDAEHAARVLINFGRCICARYRMMRQANERYRRVLDEESGAYYYLNMGTYESSWSRPSVYLHPGAEPPILLVAPEEEQALVSARQLLTNREKNPVDLWMQSNDLYTLQCS